MIKHGFEIFTPQTSATTPVQLRSMKFSLWGSKHLKNPFETVRCLSRNNVPVTCDNPQICHQSSLRKQKMIVHDNCSEQDVCGLSFGTKTLFLERGMLLIFQCIECHISVWPNNTGYIYYFFCNLGELTLKQIKINNAFVCFELRI